MSLSFAGLIKNLRQASANLLVAPSANGRMLASVPPLEPNLHNPTKALTRIASSLELYNFFKMFTPCLTIPWTLSFLDEAAIMHSQAT